MRRRSTDCRPPSRRCRPEATLSPPTRFVGAAQAPTPKVTPHRHANRPAPHRSRWIPDHRARAPRRSTEVMNHPVVDAADRGRVAVIARRRRYADSRITDSAISARDSGWMCREPLPHDRLQRGGTDGARRGHRVEFAGTALRHDPATGQPCQWAHDYPPEPATHGRTHHGAGRRRRSDWSR